MKLLTMVILGFSLASTGLLFSQQLEKRQCACKDCKCTNESHCGCHSGKGCKCGNGKSCCSQGSCQGS